MNKNIGLVLLTIGIGMTAGFGAVLSPDFRKATLAEGQLQMANNRADALHAEYCALRSEHNLKDAEGCGASPSLPDTAEEKLALFDQGDELLLVKITQARVAYRLALKKIVPLEALVVEAEVQGPEARLSGWTSAAGIGFFAGLVLLVAGAWVCRKAAAFDASEEGSSSGEAVDFGVLLTQVHASMSVLHQEMLALATPSVVDADAIKERLESIQKEDMARLCASGPRVQSLHGIEGMAALFSPLSAGERKMNRAWSALVDRHWPEALASVGGAVDDLEGTKAALAALR